MKIHSFPMRLGLLSATFLVAILQTVRAQTPSPLQEWQYSGGIILARLFEPDLPRVRVCLGSRPTFNQSMTARMPIGCRVGRSSIFIFETSPLSAQARASGTTFFVVTITR